MTIASGSVRAGYICALEDAEAADPALAGSKAAALATSIARGLPVIPGLVVTTRAHHDYLTAGGTFDTSLEEALRGAWDSLAAGAEIPLVVRSSSTVEDVAASSMAGRFRSVLDVRTFERFLEAVSSVWASAGEVSATDAGASGTDPDPHPMGVLVQRYLTPDRAGVMFGVDPVTGERTSIVVDAVVGGADKLVSGRVAAQHYVISRSGRLLAVDHQPVHLGRYPGERLLHAGELFSLARLARATERAFGSPQDVEWAITTDGTLWLLQSRPVTATAATAPTSGPVLGPGPLAETFPDPLGELEIDLWVRPLEAGVVDAFTETGAVSASRLARSPVVVTAHGRVAADLELLGFVGRRTGLRRLDPRPAARQIRVAWRTGQLRARLPQRTRLLVTETDRWLAEADLGQASAQQLLDLLGGAVSRLRELHHAEALASSLLPPAARTATSLALEVTADSQYQPEDPALLRRHPILLSLAPPSLQGRVPGPPVSPGLTRSSPGQGRMPAPLAERERLRLRARWVQELTVYAARALGRVLSARGLLNRPGDVSLFTLDELKALVAEARPPADLAERHGRELALAFSPPLPAEFRLGEHGEVVAVARRGARPTGFGTPAGGGRGVGIVSHGSVRRPPSPGDILVVRTLDPGLAGWLPGLGGLVSETGAALSHLAILAREHEVPTVVAVPDALVRFAPGTRLFVDGGTGEVRPVREEPHP